MESVDKATYPRQKWPAVAFPLFLIATAVTAMQYKIPTIVVPVMQQFQIDAYVASWLMSIFTFVGIVFSLPIGALARAFPPKRIILAAAGLACLSSMAGAFSQSVKMLLVTRAFEGVSLVCVIACGPIVIQQCVDPARTGTASGVWMLGGMIGATLAGATTPFLYNAVGFQGLWIAYAAFAALAGVVVALVVKVPASASAERSGGRRDADSLAKEDLRSEFNVFFKPNTWAFFLAFGVFQILLLSVLSYAPTAMQQQGMDASLSGFASTLPMLLAIVSSFRDKPVPSDLAAIGEVGLTGELRAVNTLGQRLSEVRRLGFTKCLIPKRTQGKLVVPEGLELIRVANIREALAALL